jgi:hypothetical protein
VTARVEPGAGAAADGPGVAAPPGRPSRLLVRPWRPLKVFAFDPSRGSSASNIVTLQVPYEALGPGPVGQSVEVVDPGFDPVQLDSSEIALRGGLDPSELDVQFHQQMAYAVAMRTIADFERGLGRRVTWPANWPGGRLRLLPHAERVLNAWLDSVGGAIHFGYDTPSPDSALPPEQVVYTCLGYDIVAHQTLHALHIALLPHYATVHDSDTAAFLEGVDDLITILQHFTFPDALLETVIDSRGRLRERTLADGASNPLLLIAPQLAAASGIQGGIRRRLLEPPDPAALQAETQVHERGAIMAAAMLDAFFAVYARRTRDLYTISGGSGERDLHPDLARRLAAEASKAARHFLDIATRSLDYCPPDGIEFGDFLRAVVTADAAAVPADRWGYRAAMISAFRARGIFPRGVTSYSDEGLRWPRAAGAQAPPPRCEGIDVRAPEADNVKVLDRWAKRHRAALGLPKRGGIRVEAAYASTTRAVGGGSPSRELVTRIMTTASGQARGSIVILDDRGEVRHVITRSAPGDEAKAARRRTGAPGDSTLGALAANRRATTGPFDRRPLQIFAFDPGRGRALGNHLTITVRREAVRPGPVGEKIAVIDYDATNKVYYDPINLDDPAILLAGGLQPTASDPGFHQQMVYAVAAATVERFEATLGRPVVWPWVRKGAEGEFANHLLIHPHAMQEPNAYYDRSLHGLAFGYFAATDEQGLRVSDQVVYTCLSHDIVVHEMTHAILDSIRGYYLEPTGVDAAAFHEGFADIVSLFQHFSFPEALLETIRRTGGRIHQAAITPETGAGPEGASIQAELTTSNPFVELAREFGEALGTREALRSALGTRPNERALESTWEAHDRGAILVAAVFDAFFTVYVRASADLLRMARAGGAISAAGDVHPALADRLAREATDAATRFAELCIRALDYCPPVDIEFGDFLRAIVTGSWDASSDDHHGAIAAVVEAFRSRGIIPAGLRSLSDDALRWPQAPLPESVRCLGLDPEPRDGKAWRKNATVLGDFAREHFEAFGLSRDVRIGVHQLEGVASQRLDPHGGLSWQLHAQFTQLRTERIDPKNPASMPFTFRGGTTVILDETGRVRYVIAKPIDDEERLRKHRQFLIESAMRGVASAYVTGRGAKLDLAALHRGF